MTPSCTCKHCIVKINIYGPNPAFCLPTIYHSFTSIIVITGRNFHTVMSIDRASTADHHPCVPPRWPLIVTSFKSTWNGCCWLKVPFFPSQSTKYRIVREKWIQIIIAERVKQEPILFLNAVIFRALIWRSSLDVYPARVLASVGFLKSLSPSRPDRKTIALNCRSIVRVQPQ